MRFDPYRLFGKKLQGCWGRSSSTGDSRLAPEHKKQREQRLGKLADTVEHFKKHAPSREVEPVFLF